MNNIQSGFDHKKNVSKRFMIQAINFFVYEAYKKGYIRIKKVKKILIKNRD